MLKLDVIQQVLDAKGRGTYLEIGVLKGDNFLGVNARTKIAVDPEFMRLPFMKFDDSFSAGAKYYFQVGSDEFFRREEQFMLQNGIDVAFIDGLHTYGQSLRDVENTLKFLNPNGLILMHDCSL